jgi:KDO2-lipid IV(A) lauroyltransferase
MKRAPVRHGLEYAVYLGLKGLLRALPHGAARSFGRGLGRLAHALDGRHRRVAAKSLRLAFPDWDASRIAATNRACFAHFGESFCDAISSMRFDRVESCERLSVEGWERLEDAESDGKGVLIMGAHLGNWEAVVKPLALYRGDLHIVGRPADNPHLNREMLRLRERFDSKTIDKHNAARRMLRVLHANEKVGILIDQRVLPREGIPVPFFGRPAWTTPVLAKLSMRTGAPVVPTYAFAAPNGRYRVEFHAPIRPSAGGEGATEEETVARLTQLYLDHVEAAIRLCPEQWLWLHDRWKNAPEATSE